MSIENERVKKIERYNDGSSKLTRLIKDFIPMKGDTKSDVTRKFISLIAVAVFLFSAYTLADFLLEAKRSNDLADKLHEIMNDDLNKPPVTTVPSGPDDPDQPVEQGPVMLSKFNTLYQMNNDLVGYLNIPTLANSDGIPYIRFPVVQTKDNDYYLKHDYEKNYSSSGWIFADYRTRLTKYSKPDNIVIHGHNMKIGSMFSHLRDYKKGVDFVKENYLIQFDTLYEEAQYMVVGVFFTNVYPEYDDGIVFQYTSYQKFYDEEYFKEFYDNVMWRSLYLTDIECTKDDEYITLSTCSTEFYESRFVVVARKVRDGEDPTQYLDSYRKNPKPHYPAILTTSKPETTEPPATTVTPPEETIPPEDNGENTGSDENNSEDSDDNTDETTNGDETETPTE